MMWCLLLRGKPWLPQNKTLEIKGNKGNSIILSGKWQDYLPLGLLVVSTSPFINGLIEENNFKEKSCDPLASTLLNDVLIQIGAKGT